MCVTESVRQEREKESHLLNLNQLKSVVHCAVAWWLPVVPVYRIIVILILTKLTHLV